MTFTTGYPKHQPAVIKGLLLLQPLFTRHVSEACSLPRDASITDRNFFPPSFSLKCALKESGCRIGYEPTKMSRDPFWLSIYRDTNVEVSRLQVMMAFVQKPLKRHDFSSSSDGQDA